jgi:hypothetical protein
MHAVQQDDAERPTVLLRGVVLDESGRPINGATIETIPDPARLQKITTQSTKDGAFLLRFPSDAYFGASIVIHDEAKKLAGYISGYRYTAVSHNVFRVTLKPIRQTDVTVVDQAGNPVPDATVRLLIDYADYQSAKTDFQGQIRLTYPDDSPVNWIVAYKDDCGLDYYENATTFLVDGKANVPGQLTLTLNGASPVRIKVVDSKDRPVPNLSVTPWTIHKQGKRDDINLSGLQLGKSDDRGIAEFRFIPQDFILGIHFLIHEKEFHCPNLPRITAGDLSYEATAKVYRVVNLSGRVLHEDGTPAGGIRLQGEGRGATNMYFRGHTSTKADGTYEISIFPDQATLIAVTDEHFASKSVELPETAEGMLLKNIDLKLNEGVLISGELTHGENRLPAVNQTATLIQQGTKGAQLVRWSRTDKGGRYQFRVGPGSYQLRLLDETQQLIEVDNRALVFDQHVDRLPRGPFTGKVVDGAGQPIKALILGESIGARGHAGFSVQGQSDGTFETEKWNDRIRLIAVSTEHKLFGTREIDADTEAIEIVLAPAASLNCKVVDDQGNSIEGCRLIARRDWAGTLLTLTGQPQPDGTYAFPALGPGMTWTIIAEHNKAGMKSIEFEIAEARTYTLPPIVLKSKADEAM